MRPLAGECSLPAVPDAGSFSNSDFRPRARSVFATQSPVGNTGDDLAFDKPVWQRLAEYRSRDRVRVLTLWESGASAVSLQTDRKGDPSLQWTSRWMNRGGATRGLLDRWMPASVFRGFAHSVGSPAGRSALPAPQAHAGLVSSP